MRCVLCGNTVLLSTASAYRYRTESFRARFPDLVVGSCSHCGLHQCDHDLLSEDGLREYYIRDYRALAVTAHPSNPKAAEFFARRGRELASLVASTLGSRDIDDLRVFEMGAGFGFNLKAISEIFPSASLYTDEPDLKAFSVSGLDGATGASLGDGNWDVIIMSHVLEHLMYPASIVRECERALRPGGLLVIEVPNDPEFILRRQLHEPHVSFFERDSLCALITSASDKLEILASGTAGPRIHRPLLPKLPGLAKLRRLYAEWRARRETVPPTMDESAATRRFVRLVARRI